MSETFFLNFVHSYLNKTYSLKKQVLKISTDYAHLKCKQRGALFFLYMLIYRLNCLIRQSLIKYHCIAWAYSKSGSWWLPIVPQMNDKQFKDNLRIQTLTFKKTLGQVEAY